MQKIGNITNTATAAGEFTDGSVASGISPTILDAGWFNTVQRELVNMVQSAGITLDPTNDAQVLAAIQALFLQKANNLSEIKAAGAVAQAAALTNLGSSDGRISGRLMGAPKTFTSSGIYTPTPGTTFILVEAQGAGGSGGSCVGANDNTQVTMSGGGTGGTYAKGIFTSNFSGILATIGAGGMAPTSGNTAGNAGGITSLGSLLIAPGGPGGIAGANFAPPNVGGGGNLSPNATGANIVSRLGTPGTNSIAISSSIITPSLGGTSFMGAGGPSSSNTPGYIGLSYGGGGGGVSLRGADLANPVAGGNGANGILIIYEYA